MTTPPDTPAGGAVAYAVRDHSDGQLWLFVRSREDAEKTAENADDEVVPLYTQPPATVSADAVLALVGKWRAKATEIAKPYGFTTEHTLGNAQSLEACADELEALTRGEK
jgi:acyl-CoA synthetase (NDP forming)